MITLNDLEQAIAECQGERYPNANTCIKLAAFLTIRRELFGKAEQSPVPAQMFSYTSAPVQMQASETPQTVTYSGNSEFAQAVQGRNASDMWAIIDDLMTSLAIKQPQLYNAVMRKINE